MSCRQVGLDAFIIVVSDGRRQRWRRNIRGCFKSWTNFYTAILHTQPYTLSYTLSTYSVSLLYSSCVNLKKSSFFSMQFISRNSRTRTYTTSIVFDSAMCDGIVPFFTGKNSLAAKGYSRQLILFRFALASLYIVLVLCALEFSVSIYVYLVHYSSYTNIISVNIYL